MIINFIFQMWGITIIALLFFSRLKNCLLNNEVLAELHMSSMADYLSNILKQQNEKGDTVFISIPAPENVTVRARVLNSVSTTESLIIEKTLKSLNQNLNFPIKIQNSSKEVSSEEHNINHAPYYLVFLRITLESEIEDNIEEQFNSIERTKSLDSTGMHLICIVNELSGHQEEIAQRILRRIHKLYNIWNSLLIFPKQKCLNISENSIYQQTEGNEFNLPFETYSLNPSAIFSSRNCSSQYEISKWTNANDTTFLLRNTNLPENLNGCTLHVSPSVIPPFASIEENSNQDESVTYKGLEIAYLQLIAENLNLTLQFHPPMPGNVFETRFRNLQIIRNGNTDILIGGMVLFPFTLQYGEATIPYVKHELRWVFPCSEPCAHFEKILDIYTVTVWVFVFLVLKLIPITLWFFSKYDCNSGISDPNVYKSIYNCICIVWAISVGVSVKHTPKTLKTRLIFIIFVYYSISISTIFQAFFITFLVEPGFPKALETFDELLKSDFKYGKNEGFEDWLKISGYHEFNKFSNNYIICEEIETCVDKLLKKEPITMTCCPEYINYHSSTFIEVPRKWCTFKQAIFSVNFSMFFQKGSLLLNRFNYLLRRCVEYGLVEKYWREMKLNRSSFNAEVNNNFINSDVLMNNDDTYFVFSVHHLKPVFIVLLLGYSISVCSFLTEFLLKLTNNWFMKTEYRNNCLL
ncbi:Ionotropic receptor 662 [Blattella germanica]|nr:Ionotropic receptor 662 [Blattella germanica]